MLNYQTVLLNRLYKTNAFNKITPLVDSTGADRVIFCIDNLTKNPRLSSKLAKVN